MQKQKTHRHKQSFTLIELLVVIAIIAILAAVIVANVTSAQSQARDVRRTQDLDQLKTALEMYYFDNGHYPDGSIGPNSISSRLGFCIEQSQDFKDFLTEGDYVYSLPQDPLYNSSQCDNPFNADCYCYFYKTDTDQKYKLFAKVEQQDFKPAIQDGGTEVTLYEVYAPILGANQIAYVAYGSGYAEPGGIPIVFAGTGNNVAKFTSPTELGDSIIYDDGTNIGIGTTSPVQKLDVRGNAYFSGNVGIGTTSPGYKLDINGGLRTNKSVFGRSVFGSMDYTTRTYSKIFSQNIPSNSTIGTAYLKININGHDRGQGRALVEMIISGRDFNVQAKITGILEQKDIIVWHNTENNKYEVYLSTYGWTWPWEIIEITSNISSGVIEPTLTTTTTLPNGSQVYSLAESTANLTLREGNVGIGTTTPDRKLKVNGEAGGTTAWYNDSDARLKTNVQTIPNALEKVEKMRGVSFAWIDTENHPKGQQIGFIAQELKDVLPEVVDKKGEYYSVQESSITAVLVEAMKEQQKQIENQQKQIEDLKAQIETLKHR